MSQKTPEFWLAMFLVLYLLIVGVGAAVGVIVNFPTEKQDVIVFPHGDTNAPAFVPFGKLNSPDQGLILLAALAGITGSFLHAAQSLSSYVGNASFKASWTVWYFLRPWIGGILGLTIYFTFRAGLVAGASAVNPYGVVALGLLGGWFSKTTTDKLQEVFETLFKTDEDKQRKDKLQATKPEVDTIIPSPVPAAQNEIKLFGRNFLDGGTVLVGGQELDAEFMSGGELKVFLAQLAQRPTGGTQVAIRVKNPEGADPLSVDSTVVFE